MADEIRIGIIGGSGLYQMEGLTSVQEVEVETPFGKASDLYRTGTLEGRRVAFLARCSGWYRSTPCAATATSPACWAP